MNFFTWKKETKKATHKYSYLDKELSAALENDFALDDFAERLQPYFHFDKEVCQAFVEAAAQAAEFLARQEEIQFKKSIPKRFREFTFVMKQRLRELRRVIRDESPMLLEEFDELRNEVDTYSADNHHNLWCDAHA